ncbi:hypothetical protein Tco_1260571, partial [Tanacetum coccineum]
RFKLDLQPLSPNLRNNREAHVDYIKVTTEHADTLRGIVEQARALKPLNNALDFACQYTKRIQELLPLSSVVSLVLTASALLPTDTTGVEEQMQGIQNAQFDMASLIHNLTSDSSSEESSSQGVIPSNLHQLNQSFDNLEK